MKFKKGQVVYFYIKNDEYYGNIITAIVSGAVKNLVTDKVTYKVQIQSGDGEFNWFSRYDNDIDEDKLYTSRKKIEKLYKEEIVLGKLHEKINKLQETLDSIYKEVKPEEMPKFYTLKDDAFSTVYIDAKSIKVGERDLMKEIDSIKKEVKSLKKKKSTKKKINNKKKDNK